MTPKTQSKGHAYVHGLMLLTIFLVAFSFPIGAAITHALPPAVLMFMRFTVASVFFAPYVFIKYGLQLPKLKSLLGYAVLSIPLVVFFYCMFEALRFTTAINTGALYTTVPAMTAVFAFFINKVNSSKLRSAGLLLGTLGALWIVFRGDLNGLLNLQFNKGDLIFLLGCLFMGAYSPLVKKLYGGEPMAVMTFWVISMAALLLFILSVGSLEKIQWLAVEPRVYFGVAFLAIFTTLFSFFVLQLATVKIGATQVAAYGFLTPIVVIALSAAAGSGEVSWSLMPGIGLVLLAMLFINAESDLRLSVGKEAAS
ncbi:MAG: DMT family transporter [Bermanella sp.]